MLRMEMFNRLSGYTNETLGLKWVKQGESSNKEKMKGYFFPQILLQNVKWFLSQYMKMLN